MLWTSSYLKRYPYVFWNPTGAIGSPFIDRSDIGLSELTFYDRSRVSLARVNQVGFVSLVGAVYQVYLPF